MTRLARVQLFLVKSEVTYGTDPTPTKVVNAIKSREGLVATPVVQNVESENVTATFSPEEARSIIPTNTVDLELELTTHGDCGVGDVANPMRIDPILQACGLIPTYTAESVPAANNGDITYKPSTTAPKSCTIWGYKDGMLHKTNGVLGTLSVDFEPGKLAVLKAALKGLHVAPTDVATPTDATYDEVLAPICVNMSLAWGPYTPIVRKATLTLNNETPDRGDLNAANGSAGTFIAARKPQLTVLVEAPLEAGHPFYGDLAAGTVRNVHFTLSGTAAGDILFTMPKLQLKDIKPSNENGAVMYELTGTACRNSAGDDELTVKFSG